MVAIGIALRRPSYVIPLFCVGFIVPNIVKVEQYIFPQPIMFFSLLWLGVLFLRLGAQSSIYREIEKITINKKIIVLYICFLLLVGVVDYFNSKGNDINKVFMYSIGLLVALNIRDKKDYNCILVSIIMTSLLLSLWTIYNMQSLLYLRRENYMVDPNYLSFFIGCGLLPLFFLTLCLSSNRFLIKPLLYAFIFMFIYSILFLSSRGVVLALVLTSLIIVLNQKKNISFGFKSAIFITIIIVVFSQLTISSTLIDRVDDNTVLSLNARLPLAIASIEDIIKAPIEKMLFGGGTGYGEVSMVGIIYKIQTSVHNDYLEIAMDYGLIGVAIIILIYINILKDLFSRTFHSNKIQISLTLFLILASLSITPLKLYSFTWVLLGYNICNIQSSYHIKSKVL
jgi:O-antigen ligase